MGSVKEPGEAYSVPHYGEGPARDLPVRRGSARHRPACHNSTRPIADIFVLTADISGWGRGKGRAGRGERPQEPDGRRGGSARAGGRNRNGEGQTSSESGWRRGQRQRRPRRTGDEAPRIRKAATEQGGSTAQGEGPKERAQTKAPDGAVRNLTERRTMKGQQPRRGQVGTANRGRQRQGGCRKAARTVVRMTQRLAGTTPGKPPPRPPTRREQGDLMGRDRRNGGGLEAGGKNRKANPRECGETTGDVRPPELPTSPPEWGMRKGATRPPE